MSVCFARAHYTMYVKRPFFTHFKHVYKGALNNHVQRSLYFVSWTLMHRKINTQRYDHFVRFCPYGIAMETDTKIANNVKHMYLCVARLTVNFV